jgi:hypothetical protein
MTKNEIKDCIDKFGVICAGEKGYKKTMFGNIKEVDSGGNTCFIDNDDLMYIFPLKQIDYFEPKEFVIIKEKPKDIMTAKKKTPKVSTEQQYKVFFTKDGVEDYFIIEGESAERAYATAISVLVQRGLDYTKNKVHSERIR